MIPTRQVRAMMPNTLDCAIPVLIGEPLIVRNAMESGTTGGVRASRNPGKHTTAAVSVAKSSERGDNHVAESIVVCQGVHG